MLVCMCLCLWFLFLCVWRFFSRLFTPGGLRCSLISSREHDARSGDFITPFEKFKVG